MFDLLNLEPNKVSKDLSSYTTLIYGNSKSGKTTLAHQLFGKDALILAFEKGYKGLSGAMAIDIKSWEDLTRDKKIEDPTTGEKKKIPSINKQLKNPQVQEKFKVLVIDVVDKMWDMCAKQICTEEGVDDLSDIPWGKGTKMCEDRFQAQLLEWQNLGYGLFFISHAVDKKMEVKDPSGTIREITKFSPTVNKRAYGVVSKMVDNIFFCYLSLGEDGKECRKIFSRETLVYHAGSRFSHLPSELLMDAETIKKAMKEAIEKEELTTNDKNILGDGIQVGQYESFEDIKNNLIDLVKNKFQKAGKMDIVKEITEKQMGVGATIGGASEADIDALDTILEYLEEKANELNL